MVRKEAFHGNNNSMSEERKNLFRHHDSSHSVQSNLRVEAAKILSDA